MKVWSRKEHGALFASVVFATFFATMPSAYAMHIMEGYLPATHCIVWGVIAAPFLVAGVISIRHIVQESHRSLILLAMAGAFIFVISSLKIPSVTGSCSHMTGTGLGAILFGVPATAILGIIVLVFQAILLAHGGLTTLGANCCSMAIFGPILTWALFRLFKKIHMNEKVNIFIAASLGDLFTYCVTSFQLALAYPSEVGGVPASIGKFLLVFAPTQIPLAIIEGLLTVLIVIGLESFAVPELKAIGFIKSGSAKNAAKTSAEKEA